MARVGKYDHLKPEILRLLAEGVTVPEIRRDHPDIPTSTVYDWAKLLSPQNPESTPDSVPEPPRARLPIDPESPIEKIKNALWDIVYSPEGKGAAVQALNILLKIEAPWVVAGNLPPADSKEDKGTKIEITRRIIDARN